MCINDTPFLSTRGAAFMISDSPTLLPHGNFNQDAGDSEPDQHSSTVLHEVSEYFPHYVVISDCGRHACDK